MFSAQFEQGQFQLYLQLQKLDFQFHDFQDGVFMIDIPIRQDLGNKSARSGFSQATWHALILKAAEVYDKDRKEAGASVKRRKKSNSHAFTKEQHQYVVGDQVKAPFGRFAYASGQFIPKMPSGEGIDVQAMQQQKGQNELYFAAEVTNTRMNGKKQEVRIRWTTGAEDSGNGRLSVWGPSSMLRAAELPAAQRKAPVQRP